MCWVGFGIATRPARPNEYFAEYWQDADPELQPMVEETRQAILRLGPLQRKSTIPTS